MTDQIPEESVENAVQRSLLLSALKLVTPGGTGREAEKPAKTGWPFPFVRTAKEFGTVLPEVAEPRLALDRVVDTKYAHSDPAFSGVLHVFCQTWTGIRAAAGSLPGRKLAVATSGVLDRKEEAWFLGLLAREQISKVVFHGLPDMSQTLIDCLARAGASNLAYMVYHGNVAQWEARNERKAALAAIALADSSKIKRLHFMQRDCPLAGDRAFVPMLFNPAPIHRSTVGSGRRQDDVVFLPGTDSWRKNLHVNALGGALSSRVSRVMHYAPDLELPQPYNAKLRRASYTDRAATFGLMARVGCTLNVSLVECHPMVGLESESVGTPCLRGRLNLDAGEDHAYARLVQVDDPNSPYDVQRRLDGILALPQPERLEMIRDYTARMDRTSLERYKEFLEL
jgi:hypothetical protein